MPCLLYSTTSVIIQYRSDFTISFYFVYIRDVIILERLYIYVFPYYIAGIYLVKIL